MPTTPRMSFPYPSYRKDPWYDDAEARDLAIDASLYTTREDRNLVLMEGGTVTWTAGTGTLTWDADIHLNASISGLTWALEADSVTIEEGEVLYVNLVRYPSSNKVLVKGIASQVPSTDAAVMLVIRRNDRLYWRDGKVINDGFSGALFTSTAGGPVASDLASVLASGNTTGGNPIVFTAGDALVMSNGATPAGTASRGSFWVSDGSGGLVLGEAYYRYGTGTIRRLIGSPLETRTVALNAQVDATVTPALQVGQFAFDASDYGTELRFQFEVILSVNLGTLTGRARLYNLTDAEYVTGTSLTTSNTTATKLNSGNLTVGSAAGNLKDTEKVYEVRIDNNGSLVTDLTFLGSAIMRVII